jgi:hypothetical protein
MSIRRNKGIWVCRIYAPDGSVMAVGTSESDDAFAQGCVVDLRNQPLWRARLTDGDPLRCTNPDPPQGAITAQPTIPDSSEHKFQAIDGCCLELDPSGDEQNFSDEGDGFAGFEF